MIFFLPNFCKAFFFLFFLFFSLRGLHPRKVPVLFVGMHCWRKLGLQGNVLLPGQGCLDPHCQQQASTPVGEMQELISYGILYTSTASVQCLQHSLWPVDQLWLSRSRPSKTSRCRWLTCSLLFAWALDLLAVLPAQLLGEGRTKESL